MPDGTHTHCFACGEPLSGHNTHAVTFEGRPGYGSQFDDTLYGIQMLCIEICDPCLALRQDRVMLVARTQPAPVVQYRPWDVRYDRNRPEDWMQGFNISDREFWNCVLARPMRRSILYGCAAVNVPSGNDCRTGLQLKISDGDVQLKEALTELMHLGVVEVDWARDPGTLRLVSITDLGCKVLKLVDNEAAADTGGTL